MRLLTKMGYKGGGLGVNVQGMTLPLEVVQIPRFASLGDIEGECSKVLEDSKTLLKLSRKENDENTSRSSHESAHWREIAKATTHHQNRTRTVEKGIASLSILQFILIANILLMININHGIENYVVFLVYITMWLLSAERGWQQERG